MERMGCVPRCGATLWGARVPARPAVLYPVDFWALILRQYK
jgi:hypothetical protein